MKPEIEVFKKRLDGWYAYHQLGDMKWSDKSECTELPEWVEAVVDVEEGPLYMVFNGYTDDTTLEDQFESLAAKCGVNYERPDECNLWIYVPEKETV